MIEGITIAIFAAALFVLGAFFGAWLNKRNREVYQVEKPVIVKVPEIVRPPGNPGVAYMGEKRSFVSRDEAETNKAVQTIINNTPEV